MTWQGGFTGDSYDRAGFRDWLRKQKKPSFMSFVTVHATGAPYTLATVGGAQRVKNLGHYYQSKGWKGGPHLFVMEDRIYPGTPIHLPTVHSPSWNNISLAMEVEGTYDGTHSPLAGQGKVAWQTASWVLAELLLWIGWVPDAKHIMLHCEDPRTTHKVCPGPLIKKSWLLTSVEAANHPVSIAAAPVAVVPPARPPEKVMSPGKFVASEEWAVPMMKRVEGLPPMKEVGKDNFTRLYAYPDPPGWSIGYGHNSTSGVPPIPVDGMVLKTQADADDVLRADLKEHCRYLNAWVMVPLTEGEVDALCMFMHQQGPTSFRSKLLPYVNAKKHWTVARVIETMPHAKAGVVRRRKLEAARYRGEKPTSW